MTPVLPPVTPRAWRRFFPALLVAGACLLSASARAEVSWHATLQTYSIHEGNARDVEDFTPGLGLMRRQNDWLAGAGVFRNSVGRWAGYGYVGYQYPFRRFRVGGIGGLTHNYRWKNGGVVPLAAAVVTVPITSRFSVDLIGIPAIRDVSYGAVNVSFSWRFR